MAIALRGWTVLVTGASSGIGRATALTLASYGVRLMMCARSVDRLPTEEECKAAGAEAVYRFAMDVSKPDEIKQAAEALPEEWKKVDILVNNAGKARGLTKIYEDDPENWDEMIDTNVKGLLRVSRTFIPGMVERGRGHVVNIGSTAGHWVYGNGVVYCATKSAERAINEGMKIDLTGTPVRVTTIDPGMVETNFSVVRFGGDSDKASKVYAGVTPLTPEDIADAIAYAVTRPLHVNVQTMLIMPTDQGNATVFNRRS